MRNSHNITLTNNDSLTEDEETTWSLPGAVVGFISWLFALAMPMFACFQQKADLRPYGHLVPKTDLDAVTKKTAWGVKETGTMNLTKEDAADDLLLNEVIWRNIRGADSPMPAPVRRAWVLAGDQDDE